MELHNNFILFSISFVIFIDFMNTDTILKI